MLKKISIKFHQPVEVLEQFEDSVFPIRKHGGTPSVRIILVATVRISNLPTKGV